MSDCPPIKCNAECCKYLKREYAVALTSEDEHLMEHSVIIDGKSVIPLKNGACIFLNEDNKCNIYNERPYYCKLFNCGEGFNAFGEGKHDKFLEDHPHLVDALKIINYQKPFTGFVSECD